jgi:nitrogen-specific signal transduction histidine kinase
VIDVTARRRAEDALHEAQERLRQSEKMEAIGQLTGGVAHDFNNMLQGIGGCLDMMERRIGQGRTADAARYLPPARQAIDRAAHLTNRMLAFARRQTLQPRAVDPDRLVLGMEELLRRTLGPAVELTLSLHDGVWLILCDPNQLETALLNVAINARDAMPEGGSLVIATEDRVVGPAEAQDDAPAGPYVAISVTDTGTGMSATTMERMFDPFFTTKPTGQGTGLGLSQVYGFVRQSGGFVRVRSAPGHGTTVTIHMPRHAQAVPGADETPSESPAPVPMPMADGARVLMVEDDPGVRAVISEALHDLGCTVLEADDGVAGWQIVQSDAPLDLLITDVGLPAMNGRQLAEAARAMRPGLPVLIITGYAGAVLSDLALPPEMQLLRKPFTLEELSPVVLELLASAPARRAEEIC